MHFQEGAAWYLNNKVVFYALFNNVISEQNNAGIKKVKDKEDQLTYWKTKKQRK